MRDKLKPFLDEEGRLKQYPAKQGRQLLALEYIASKFDDEKRYTEREVNQLLETWHTFGDWALLRRDLYDVGLLNRTPDGVAYWLNKKNSNIANPLA
ncbi:MAG: DUF2087 domain-containing protein [Oscillospiraceae bacterium]|jgi:hypothetical protein|nr:DUF2087 domain-containing protein [Oscillospiraceae bacterium]